MNEFPSASNVSRAQQHARFIVRECTDMLMGTGDGGMFTHAMKRVAEQALDSEDFTTLAEFAITACRLCSQWLDEWANHDSQVAGFYAGITAVLDEQDSGLPMDGLRLAAAKALIAFDAERLRHLYDRLAA